MNITKCFKPFEHIIVDDVYTKDELSKIWREIYFLKDKFKAPHETESALTEDGVALKSNAALFIDNVYTDRAFSDILQINRRAFGEEILNAISELHPAYGFAKCCNKDVTLINYYADGGYYKAHLDHAAFTFITFLVQELQKFSGGDFLFPDFDYTVTQRNNKLIVFPGCIRHQVTEVKLNTPDSEGRFSMTQFLNLKG